MRALHAGRLALAFALELAALAAFGYAGAHVGDGVVPVLCAAGGVALGIVLWGRFAAPRSPHRLPAGPRAVFSLGFFAAAVAVLVAVGATTAAVVLGVAVVADLALWVVLPAVPADR